MTDSTDVLPSVNVLYHFRLRSLHQWILTNATVLKDPDFGFMMVVYEKFFLTILKCLEEIKKCVSKIILQKNILYYHDPSYVLGFPH